MFLQEINAETQFLILIPIYLTSLGPAMPGWLLGLVRAVGVGIYYHIHHFDNGFWYV